MLIDERHWWECFFISKRSPHHFGYNVITCLCFFCIHSFNQQTRCFLFVFLIEYLLFHFQLVWWNSQTGYHWTGPHLVSTISSWKLRLTADVPRGQTNQLKTIKVDVRWHLIHFLSCLFWISCGAEKKVSVSSFPLSPLLFFSLAAEKVTLGQFRPARFSLDHSGEEKNDIFKPFLQSSFISHTTSTMDSTN